MWAEAASEPHRVVADRPQAACCTSAARAATLYALWAQTGKVKWTFKASGAIKASPALSGGTLYFGDYSGRMYAVWARPGAERWSSGTSGRTFGFAAGNFYSTPAVDFRPRLRRQHRQQGLLVQRQQRRACLVQVDRRLRLLVAGRSERRRARADRLRRLLRPEPVCARRSHRRRALDRPRRWPDLGRADGDRENRLLRGPGLEVHLRCRCRDRQAASSSGARARTTRWSPTAAASS